MLKEAQYNFLSKLILDGLKLCFRKENPLGHEGFLFVGGQQQQQQQQQNSITINILWIFNQGPSNPQFRDTVDLI